MFLTPPDFQEQIGKMRGRRPGHVKVRKSVKIKWEWFSIVTDPFNSLIIVTDPFNSLIGRTFCRLFYRLPAR